MDEEPLQDMQGIEAPADHNRLYHACRIVEQMAQGQAWWMIGEDQMVPAPEQLHSFPGSLGALKSRHRHAAPAPVVWLLGSLWCASRQSSARSHAQPSHARGIGPRVPSRSVKGNHGPHNHHHIELIKVEVHSPYAS